MKNILIVEDDIFSIQPIQDHLIILGHRVTLAENALEAIAEFSSAKKYDILLLDIMLAPCGVFDPTSTAGGRYTGLKLLEYAKTTDQNTAIINAKIALITNWRDEPKIDQISQKFNTTVFRKPLELDLIETFVS